MHHLLGQRFLLFRTVGNLIDQKKVIVGIAFSIGAILIVIAFTGIFIVEAVADRGVFVINKFTGSGRFCTGSSCFDLQTRAPLPR